MKIEELQAELLLLRQELLVETAQSFVNLFDEFMNEGEFGLALHVVCDFLLEPDFPRVTESTLDRIQRLHTAMKLDDSCVQDLQDRKLP
jgi:hypothetical protein